MSLFTQSAHSVCFDWGPTAIKEFGSTVDCIVIIDVMSFSSCVSVALEAGAVVYPYPWRDGTAQAYADARGALVADSKRRWGAGLSLSPQSLISVAAGTRLVLPSPNGSACAFLARDLGKAVYCASLRNLAATAAACQFFDRILVLACGERWNHDNSLRPCLEDLVAAGGLIAALGDKSHSPEAHAAALTYKGFGQERTKALRACGSAIELTQRGFAEDVELCLQENVSSFACKLQGEFFESER